MPTAFADIGPEPVDTLPPAIARRLGELRDIAQNENAIYSQVSAEQLRAFIAANGVTRRPLLSLLDNGNLRALWDAPSGEQVGLQFRGGSEIQFVFFARRFNPDGMMRSAGRDTIAGVAEQIASLKLTGLLHV